MPVDNQSGLPSVRVSRATQLTPFVYLVGSGPFGLSHLKDCNVYLVGDKDSWALIDTGVGLDVDAISAAITTASGRSGHLDGIFLTHAHADHSGGAAALRERFSTLVAASVIDGRLIESGDEALLGLAQAKYLGRYPRDYVFPRCPIGLWLEDNHDFHIGRISVHTLLTPGHSAGSLCFLADFPDGTRGLFSGDTVLWGGYISLLNTPGSDLHSYRQTAQRMASIRIDALFPGHHIWDLTRGQNHLDVMVERFRGSVLPPNAPW